MTTKTKSLKPIDIDAQFKYKCADADCGCEYWLFFNQVKVKGFKLVCDCGAVYKIKQIDGIKIQYSKKASKNTVTQEPTKNKQSTPDYLIKAYKILEHYGFSNKESIDLVTKVHDITGCTDSVLLVKDALKFLGGI